MKRIRIGLTEVESLCNLASHTDRTLCGSVQLGIPWNARAASTSPWGPGALRRTHSCI